MKYFIVLLIANLFITCKTNKGVTLEKKTEQVVNNLEPFCPDDGICTIRLDKNQKLDIIADEFGKLYYQKTPNVFTSIIVFEYSKNVPEGLQDGSYREEIIFEIENSTQKLELKDSELAQVKMLFGRHCYCKGQAGCFKIDTGILNLSQNQDSISFNLNFTNNKVPQILKNINYIINKKQL